MKVIVGIHWRRPSVGVRREVGVKVDPAPDYVCQEKKILFSKISTVYMYDFYNLNTCDECLFLNIKTNIKEHWAGRELVKEWIDAGL